MKKIEIMKKLLSIILVGFLIFPAIGQALNFDGGDDYVTMGNIAAIPTGNSQRTFSVWFYADVFPTDTTRPILGQADSVTAGRTFNVFAEDNAVSIGMEGHRIITPKGALAVSTWYHVAIIVPSGATQTSNVLVYINGSLQTLATEAGTVRTLNTDTGDLFNIANSSVAGPNGFDGQITDARVYNRALTPSEVKALYYGKYHSYNGLVGYWPLWGGSLPFMPDLSGRKNHGTAVGSPISIFRGPPIGRYRR